MKASVLLLLLPLMSQAANYTAEKLTVDGLEVVRLTDAAHKTEVLVAPSMGNNSYEMKVNGKRVFWNPYNSLAEFKAKPVNLGNPFLAPWANRIDGDSFYANGKKYTLNPALNNFRYDGNKKPIHGLVMYSPEWKVTSAKANGKSAEVTSRLEFWKHPDWMAQFPFAHNIEMTYRLQDGVLEVITEIENLSTEPMPIGIGYHPYFTLTTLHGINGKFTCRRRSIWSFLTFSSPPVRLNRWSSAIRRRWKVFSWTTSSAVLFAGRMDALSSRYKATRRRSPYSRSQVSDCGRIRAQRA